ncbi:cation:proton antiporter [Neorhizobium petrolearium]|uniref:cation:proton antiporter n=1 Tax=Neorhizobium petrolearium TaxID=515361 RepID=UPI003F18CF08
MTAGFAWFNHVFIHLPHTIGLLVMGIVSSLLLVVVELLLPDVHLHENLTALVRHIDFQRTVLDGILAFLLFAGALHVDFSHLKRRIGPVGLMATLGVLISTLIVGSGLWLLSSLVGQSVPLIWALVFGALISPTDPVAVLATLKSVKVPQFLETDMAGESLFNDGVGVVVFTALLLITTGSEGSGFEASSILELFVVEALGGALLGLATGYLAYIAMRQIDDYPIEVLISIALVMGTYSLASLLHASGPIAVVVAGLIIGNQGPKDAMSDMTQRYLFGYWTLVDEILNMLLFLLIGLEVLVLRFEPTLTMLALLLLPVILFARLAATAIPVQLLQRWHSFVPGTVAVLTWGGLRGGISMALALSLPEGPEKAVILTATYVTVVFTIVVQGLTLKSVIKRYITEEHAGRS